MTLPGKPSAREDGIAQPGNRVVVACEVLIEVAEIAPVIEDQRLLEDQFDQRTILVA